MSHEAVKKELAAGTPAEVICACCPWDRLCLHPPKMTPEEVERHVAKAADDVERRAGTGKAAATAVILAAGIYGGRDTDGRMCPVLALRLRSDRQVADGVRDLMRAYQPPDTTPR